MREPTECGWKLKGTGHPARGTPFCTLRGRIRQDGVLALA
jgi:hypothetical protein